MRPAPPTPVSLEDLYDSRFYTQEIREHRAQMLLEWASYVRSTVIVASNWPKP